MRKIFKKIQKMFHRHKWFVMILFEDPQGKEEVLLSVCKKCGQHKGKWADKVNK